MRNDHPDPSQGACGGTPPPDVTLLLKRVESGDLDASGDLLPVVYEQLRSVARANFRAQDAAHTLQPTALVHEAYLKLVRSPGPGWSGREHFCAVAATAMRQILADHARAKRAKKRSPSGDRTPVTQIETPTGERAIDMLALDEALAALSEADAQGSRMIELRYFGGLSIDESAGVIGISPRTADRVWRRSRAWIRARLGEADG